MIAKLLLAAIAAGLVAGMLMTGVQQMRLVPLILHAEVFEKAEAHHDHAASVAQPAPAAPAAHEMSADSDDEQMLFGLNRYSGSLIANLVTGAGYGLLLAAVALLTGNAITLRSGLAWGACAWTAVHLMPSIGLPPELPGMPVADLTARQVWWVSTVLASAAGIYLLMLRPEHWLKALGVVLLAAPHLIGAPQPPTLESLVPATLSAEFAASALASTLFFWLVLGLGLGLVTERAALTEAFGAT
jgi:cobalt transporter subunit CbtA